jgi:hypothetical protein
VEPSDIVFVMAHGHGLSSSKQNAPAPDQPTVESEEPVARFEEQRPSSEEPGERPQLIRPLGHRVPALLALLLPASFRASVWTLVLEEDKAAYLRTAVACDSKLRLSLIRAWFRLLPVVRFIQSIFTMTLDPLVQLLERIRWRIR